MFWLAYFCASNVANVGYKYFSSRLWRFYMCGILHIFEIIHCNYGNMCFMRQEVEVYNQINI